MNQYSIPLALARVCILALSIGPAGAQGEAGSEAAMAWPPEQVAEPVPIRVVKLVADASGVREVPAEAAGAGRVDDAGREPAAAAAVRGARITLTTDEWPVARRPLPPMPAPAAHPMERDVKTLKAAYAALQLEDAIGKSRLAALR